MIFKDSLILSFFFDKDDPEEQEAFESLIKSLDVKLKTLKLGRFDDYSYDVKGQCFRIDLSGNNAETMLQAIIPVVGDADFVIGPKATLIMRGYENKGKAIIKHVDL